MDNLNPEDHASLSSRGTLIYNNGDREEIPRHIAEDSDLLKRLRGVNLNLQINIPKYDELIVSHQLQCPNRVLMSGLRRLLRSYRPLSEEEKNIICQYPLLAAVGNREGLIETGGRWSIQEMSLWTYLRTDGEDILPERFHFHLFTYLCQGIEIINPDQVESISEIEINLLEEPRIELLVPRIIKLIEILDIVGYPATILTFMTSSVKLLRLIVEEVAKDNLDLTLDDLTDTLEALTICTLSKSRLNNLYITLARIAGIISAKNLEEGLQFIAVRNRMMENLGSSLIIILGLYTTEIIPRLLPILKPEYYHLEDLMDAFISVNYTEIASILRIEWKGELRRIGGILCGLKNKLPRDFLLDHLRRFRPSYVTYLAHHAIYYHNSSVLKKILEIFPEVNLIIGWAIIRSMEPPVLEEFIKIIGSYPDLNITTIIPGRVRESHLREILAFPHLEWFINRLEFFSAAGILNLIMELYLWKDHLFYIFNPQDINHLLTTLPSHYLDKIKIDHQISTFKPVPDSVRIFGCMTRESKIDLKSVVHRLLGMDDVDEFCRILPYLIGKGFILSTLVSITAIITSKIIREILRRRHHGEPSIRLRIGLLKKNDIDGLEDYPYLTQLMKSIAYSYERVTDIALGGGPLWHLMAHNISSRRLKDTLENSGDSKAYFLQAIRSARIRL